MAKAAALAFLSLTAGAFEMAVQAAGNSPAPFAEKMFGVWLPKKGVPIKSVLGPIAYDFLATGPGKMTSGFTALRHNKTGDVWFTLLDGQMWHVVGKQVQYCFGQSVLLEQSPFEIQSITNTSVNMCWRSGDRGMPTHTKGCTGCDCARILLSMPDPDTLRFQFWQSPPVMHADATFVRSGPQPQFKDAISSTMIGPYEQCRIKDHYGPNVPGEPDLRNKTYSKTEYTLPGGCSQSTVFNAMKNDDIMAELGEMSAEVDTNENGGGQCRQLNGLNLKTDTQARKTDPSKVMNVSDVKMQYVRPNGACNPCDVSYSISAKIEEDEYIAVGFKGQSWEHEDPYPPEISRPCYFGMCVDSYDNFTSDRIAVGYTSNNGGCVREMVSPNIVGEPVDADYKLLKKTSIERNGDRAILRFTISQHWPKRQIKIPDGPFRVMWAIGKVGSGNGCASKLQYHNHHRGVAPVDWLLTLGSTPCKYNPSEMGATVVYT